MLRYTPDFIKTLRDLNHKGSERQGEEKIEEFDLSKHIMSVSCKTQGGFRWKVDMVS